MEVSTVKMIYAPPIVQIQDISSNEIVKEFHEADDYKANLTAAEQWLAEHNYVSIPGPESLWEQRITG
jgi:hypothetical protein